ncbi:golgin candidate 4-like [Chenopodium quinoa]|uniref:Golgin candidate 4 n=1 Tax=Chenopodium quinoa TaxID=63459 RepID=A0A803M327_CHEQI|nr:golgin candidate 4-like [Chenopodium quinoa]
MWSSIANLKENLNKIALDVHDDDDDEDELSIHAYDSPYSDRRRSHSLAHSKSPSYSPNLSNGNDSPYVSEIERYKSEIKKLRDSEAEIKALSVNYAALLKEKEDHIVRLYQENGSLKQNLEVTNAALSTARNEASRASTSSMDVQKGSGEQSPSRQNKHGTSARNRSSGNQWQNGVVSKQDGISNGFLHTNQADSDSKYSDSRREKELADMLEEKNRLLAAMQKDHELQVKKLEAELEKDRAELANTKVKLQDEVKTSGSLTEKLKLLKSGHNETSFEVNKLRQEVDEKESEIKRLQMELRRRQSEGANDTDDLRRTISSLEKENVELKAEKKKLESTLSDTTGAGKLQYSNFIEDGHAFTSFPGEAELEHSLKQIEKELEETRRGRDKAKQELARLKQHLLDKELEESEKMDEDSKIIEELRRHVEYQKVTISNLERTLGQARASQEEIKMMNDHELQQSKEIIEDLKKKLGSFMGVIDAKNTEILNLQTALGQYYAEIEAKERLEGDLSLSREECSKLSQLLQESQQQVEASNKEKEEILAKLAQADKSVAEWKNRVNKLEEDNAKLRRALEQSMTRLNRMSVDSDFLVDRRIVIKLLVTYFQRNHSKEVLDLMVRMLGFSDEDKQRIGAAQQGGKGVVRGVLGLPGRFVGGFMGGGSAGTPANMASENQSFADLWVDYLLKQSEEREKRESAESTEVSKGDVSGSSSSTPTAPPALPDRRAISSGRPPIFSTTNPSIDTSRSSHSYQSSKPYDLPAAEFSTVPLTPSGKQFS